MERNKKLGQACFLNSVFRGIMLLTIVILAAWLCKSIVVTVYYIPSGSMMPTLKPGNYILVSKFIYNLRTAEHYPLTNIPFPFFSTGGLGEVSWDDIVVFDLPVFPAGWHPSRKEDYIKRCIGLPGDTVGMYNGKYYLKGENDTFIQSLTGEPLTNTMKIPEKGEWINLADATKEVWEPILSRDGNSIQFDTTGAVFINGVEKTKYRVKQNYYFVQGDYSRLSADSRSWGLVPHRNIIGRAELVIWPWPPRWL